MHALIDSDILVYRVGHTTNEESVEIARYRMDTAIQLILNALEAKDFTCYLTSQDKSNFRCEIFPEYKAHRTQPKPVHYLHLRNYLIGTYNAQVAFGEEADDAMGKDQTGETCICTIDKDLDQIPGWHYNFVTLRKYQISPVEAYRSFFEQVLVGDASDGVNGCPRIGKVRANGILEGCQDENEMLNAVLKQYHKAFVKDAHLQFALAAKLLWIRRKDAPEWHTNPSLKYTFRRFFEDINDDSFTSQESTSTSSPSIDELTSPIGNSTED